MLNSQLQDTQFSKVEEANRKGYMLSVNGEEFKNILVQLLETLKNDQTTLDKINEYIKAQKNSAKLTTSEIDNYIKQINNNADLNDETIKITVYQANGKTEKIAVETNEVKVQLEKIKAENSLQYIISLEMVSGEENGKISLTANYTDLSSMQNVTENYELGFENFTTTQNNSNINFTYQFNNNVTFTDSVKIEEFSDENAMILTNYDTEQVSNFLNSVSERIQTVNKQQMEQLGLTEDENPLFQMLMPFTGMALYDQTASVIDKDMVDAAEISAYNQKYEMYKSTNLQGTTVKGLLTTIALDNGLDDAENTLEEENTSKTNSYQIKEINFNGEEYEVNQQNITFIKSEIEVEGYYRVEFEMDEDTGAIYRAVINKK